MQGAPELIRPPELIQKRSEFTRLAELIQATPELVHGPELIQVRGELIQQWQHYELIQHRPEFMQRQISSDRGWINTATCINSGQPRVNSTTWINPGVT